jgi:putative component of toxin-antitoxin plasmid stabilization module
MVTKVLPLRMVEVLEYLDQHGCSPFADWFNGLDAQAAAKVSTAQTKLGLGNWSNVKGVGGGVYERVFDLSDHLKSGHT